MQLFANRETVPLNFMAAPGMPHRQVIDALAEIANERSIQFICETPNFEDPYDARDFSNGEFNAATPGGVAVPTIDVPFPPLAAIDEDQAMFAGLWVTYFDEYTDSDATEPPTGEILRLIGKNDREGWPWLPIAGIRRGQFDVSSVVYSPDERQRELTYGRVGLRTEVLNPVVDFVGQGIYLYGNRTMKRQAGAMDQFHARWTANIVQEDLLFSGRDLVFQLNDETLWREAEARVRRVMDPVLENGGLRSYEALCDSTTNTPTTISQRRVVVKVFMNIVEVAEDIEFFLIFTPTNAQVAFAPPAG